MRDRVLIALTLSHFSSAAAGWRGGADGVWEDEWVTTQEKHFVLANKRYDKRAVKHGMSLLRTLIHQCYVNRLVPPLT